jgi:hypothetical protein
MNFSDLVPGLFYSSLISDKVRIVLSSRGYSKVSDDCDCMVLHSNSLAEPVFLDQETIELRRAIWKQKLPLVLSAHTESSAQVNNTAGFRLEYSVNDTLQCNTILLYFRCLMRKITQSFTAYGIQITLSALLRKPYARATRWALHSLVETPCHSLHREQYRICHRVYRLLLLSRRQGYPLAVDPLREFL